MNTQLLFGFLFFFQAISAQPPGIDWQKCLGGSNFDGAASVQQITGGGYIVAGSTWSNNGDVSGNHGGVDAWVVKLNSTGGIVWQKCLGGSAFDWALSIQQTTDGGFIMAAITFSNNGDVSGNHGGQDYWIVKLTSGGAIQWQKCFGGTGDDYAKSIQQTSDGGYIVAGDTDSNNGDVSGNHGGRDFWVVKLNSSGGIVWQKCLGGSLWEQSQTIRQTTDGGYVVTGEVSSDDGDVSGWHEGYDPFGTPFTDLWVVRLNANGGIVWQECLGGSEGEYGVSIQQTTEGGYIVAGGTNSNDGDVSGNHGIFDSWIVKLNSSGGIEWQKCLGGSGWDGAASIHQDIEGEYIVGGYTESNNGDVSGNHGGQDFWVVKLNSDGSIIWQKCLGGSMDDDSREININTDGSYVIAGRTDSNDGDVSDNHGNSDVWVVKLGDSPDCPMLNASGVITNPLCAGSNNGSINIAPPTNGTPPYNYNWSNGATSEDVNGLNAGIYSLTITDDESCETTLSYTLINPQPMVLAITSQPVSCYEEEDGVLTVISTGGTPGYSYLWSNGATTSIITGLSPGTYTVTVTDSHNCTLTSTGQITGPQPLTLDVSGQNISCFGMSNGTATVDVSGGIPGYVYEWSNDETNSFISNLNVGTYTVTVTDDNGCVETSSVQITQPSALVLSLVGNGVTCFGNSDGSASVSVSGGSQGYGYLWSNGANTDSIYGLPAGTYFITVTDAHGCTTSGNVDVVSPLSALTLSIESENISCFGATGSAFATANGGTEPLSYSWSNGATTDLIDSLNVGTYSLTVSDANGCLIIDSVMIEVFDSIAPSIIQSSDTLYVNTVGAIEDFTQLEDDFLDNCGAFTYEVLNAEELVCDQLQMDTLEVIVTDGFGNDTVYTLLITLLDTFPPQFENCPVDIEQGSCQGPVIFSEPIALDNCLITSFVQISGLPSGSVFPIGATINDWMATDGNGNTTHCSNVVIISEGILLETNVQPITCHNQNDGSITVDTSHLTPPYSIVWNTGDTTATLHDLGEGNYTVMVTDDHNCEAVDTFILINPEFLFASLQEVHDASSANSSDGYLTINVSGGTPPYTYEWYSEGDSLVSHEQNPVNLGPGHYILFLRDSHQCLFIGLSAEIGIATGVQEFGNTRLNVWPNPSKDLLHIEATEKIESITLYDISGQLLESRQALDSKSVKINMSGKHQGLYILVIWEGTGELKMTSVLVAKTDGIR